MTLNDFRVIRGDEHVGSLFRFPCYWTTMTTALNGFIFETVNSNGDYYHVNYIEMTAQGHRRSWTMGVLTSPNSVPI